MEQLQTKGAEPCKATVKGQLSSSPPTQHFWSFFFFFFPTLSPSVNAGNFLKDFNNMNTLGKSTKKSQVYKV